MAHGDAQEGKWRRNWRMQWVASTIHTTSEHGVSSTTTADAHISAASSRLNWHPRQLNGLVRFAERWNLVSARVPSHFKRSLPPTWLLPRFASNCDLRGSGRANVSCDARHKTYRPSVYFCANLPFLILVQETRGRVKLTARNLIPSAR